MNLLTGTETDPGLRWGLMAVMVGMGYLLLARRR